MLTFTRAGREGSLSLTGIRSTPACVWPCAGVLWAPKVSVATAIVAKTSLPLKIDEYRLVCLFMVF
jgi:hypothetical protein